MPSGYATYQRTDRFGSLDGLRCLSIVAVIWCHTAANAWPGVPLLSRGYLGVELFFAISGFLITTLLLRERRQSGCIALRNFYVRRTLRIFPLYYTVLLIYTLVVWFGEKNPEARVGFFQNLPYYASYTSNWFVALIGGRVIFYFAWSLAAEEQFYLFWPTMEKTLRGYWPVLAMSVGVFVVLGAQLGLLDRMLPVDTFVHRIITRVPLAICLGVLLAHLLDDPRGYALARRLLGAWWSSLAAAAALFAAMAWAGTPP
jgi:peptidoglycan/LPS O-acetylase OafA/YrhL